MSRTQNENLYYENMAKHGFSFGVSAALIEIEKKLRGWYEKELGESKANYSTKIERDEKTNIPYTVIYWRNGKPSTRIPTPDLENDAILTLNDIMKNHKDYAYYLQTDPRGCALYLYKKDDLKNEKLGIDSLYLSIGLAICY